MVTVHNGQKMSKQGMRPLYRAETLKGKIFSEMLNHDTPPHTHTEMKRDREIKRDREKERDTCLLPGVEGESLH